MKITQYEANDNTVTLHIEPEHPAETALFKLMAACDARIESVPAPAEQTVPSDNIIVTAVVKKPRGF